MPDLRAVAGLPPPPRAIFLARPGLRYGERPPPPALRPWVAAVWTLEVAAPTTLRVLPDGCVDLIGGRVVGPMTRAVEVGLEPGRGGGIRLRPGAFPTLFGPAAQELLDGDAALEELLADTRLRAAARRGGADAWRGAVAPLGAGDAPQGPYRHDLALLLALARDAAAPDPLAAAALEAPDVRTLATRSGYSPRQLRRRLTAATGHAPKRLGRIGRMQRLLAAGRGESWARTAAEHGFADEAHMVHDVTALAGLSPHRLQREA